MRPFRFFFGTALALVLFVFFAKFLVFAFFLALLFKVVHTIFHSFSRRRSFDRYDRDCYYDEKYADAYDGRMEFEKFFDWKSYRNHKFWEEEEDYNYAERIIEVK